MRLRFTRSAFRCAGPAVQCHCTANDQFFNRWASRWEGTGLVVRWPCIFQLQRVMTLFHGGVCKYPPWLAMATLLDPKLLSKPIGSNRTQSTHLHHLRSHL
jgi:hypothetical protein